MRAADEAGHSMIDRTKIEEVVRSRGYPEFRWVSGKDVHVRSWVRMKCMFGCKTYGTRGTCPPSVPSVADCREFFAEYEHILVIRITGQLDDPEKRHGWSRKVNLDLLKIEREAFLLGHPKAFLLFMDECQICEDCAAVRAECKDKKHARPCPEGLGVDVFSTVRALGYPIDVLTDYDQQMNRYSFLLVE
jgi:predicted metal-binding protein